MKTKTRFLTGDVSLLDALKFEVELRSPRHREHSDRRRHMLRFFDGRDGAEAYNLYGGNSVRLESFAAEIREQPVYWAEVPRRRRFWHDGMTPDELHRLFPRAIIYEGPTVLAAYGDTASEQEDRSVSYGSYGNRGRGAELGVK